MKSPDTSWRDWETYFWVIAGFNLGSYFFLWYESRGTQNPEIDMSVTNMIMFILMIIQAIILLVGLFLGKGAKLTGLIFSIILLIYLLAVL